MIQLQYNNTDHFMLFIDPFEIAFGEWINEWMNEWEMNDLMF